MKYMLLIYLDEQSLSETERQDCYAESTQLAHQLKSSGQYLAANPNGYCGLGGTGISCPVGLVASDGE